MNAVPQWDQKVDLVNTALEIGLGQGQEIEGQGQEDLGQGLEGQGQNQEIDQRKKEKGLPPHLVLTMLQEGE